MSRQATAEGLPGIDHAVRREVRKGYRNLQSDVHKNKHELVQPGNDGLISLLDNAQALSNKVIAPAEAVLDSNLLKTVAEMGVQQARNLNTSRITFDLQDMAKKCAKVMSGAPRGLDDSDDEDTGRRLRLGKLDWSKLDDICAPCLVHRAPVATFMYGPMALKARERKQAQRRQADKTGEKVTPTQLESANQYQETTTEEVARVAKFLQQTLEANDQYEAVPYFDFVLNPTSFSQSVENIFHTAFLVKDNVAFIKFAGNEPFIGLTKNGANENGEVARKQFIVELDIELWQELIEVFEITEPCIPTRADPVSTSQAASH